MSIGREKSLKRLLCSRRAIEWHVRVMLKNHHLYYDGHKRRPKHIDVRVATSLILTEKYIWMRPVEAPPPERD